MRAIIKTVAANFEEVGASICFVSVIGLTIYTIINRYVLQQSGVWAPELAEMVFAWMVFLGASAAWKRNMHVSIDVLVRYLGSPARVAIQVLGDLILIVFLAYATYLSVKITLSSHSRLSPVLRIPFSYVYASAAVAFSLMSVRKAIALMQTLRSGRGPGQ